MYIVAAILLKLARNRPLLFDEVSVAFLRPLFRCCGTYDIIAVWYLAIEALKSYSIHM